MKRPARQLSNILEENDDLVHHQDSPLVEPLIEKSDSSKEELGQLQFKPQIKIFEPGEDDDQSQKSNRSQPKEEKQKQIIVMAGQSGFDLDEIFGFGKNNLNPDKRKRFTLAKRITKIFGGATQDDEDDEDIFAKLPSYFIKYLVVQSVFIGSFMVPWIQCIPSNKLLRLVWRFFFQILMLIPFCLYERRTGNEKIKACYDLKYIFKKENFRKLYISSLNTSINMLVGAQMFEWTHIGHVVLFANMSNFWLSMNRQLNGETSLFVEKCGRFMCIIGIIIISTDIYQLNVENLPSDLFLFRNPNFKYLYRDPWQRVFIGNLFTIVSCAMMAKLSKYTMDIKNIYPPFLSMFIISNILFFKIAIYSYFFDGCSFSADQRWGFFGIIQESRFTEFMCMSILLNLGMIMSQLFISRLFEPIVPATFALLEPMINTFWLHLLEVQYFPGSFSGMGYLMIQPGQFVIILGQHILSKENELKAKQQIRNSLKPENQVKPLLPSPQVQSSTNLLAPPKLSGILKNNVPVFSSDNLDKQKQKKPQKMKVSFVQHDEQTSPQKEKQQ